jgi:hypothetical protein
MSYINLDFYLEKNKESLENPEMKKLFRDLKDSKKNKKASGKKSSEE